MSVTVPGGVVVLGLAVGLPAAVAGGADDVAAGGPGTGAAGGGAAGAGGFPSCVRSCDCTASLGLCNRT